MLTKNFYNIFAQTFRRRTSSLHTVEITDVTGETQTMKLCSASPYMPDTMLGGICTAYAQWHGIWHGVFFGTGKTPPTVNDIIMESPISVASNDATRGDLLLQSPGGNGISVVIGDEYTQLAATHYVTNNTANTIEISELGLYGKFENDPGIMPFLLDHTVLDEPVILPPGETQAITYEIRFPYGK